MAIDYEKTKVAIPLAIIMVVGLTAVLGFTKLKDLETDLKIKTAESNIGGNQKDLEVRVVILEAKVDKINEGVEDIQRSQGQLMEVLLEEYGDRNR